MHESLQHVGNKPFILHAQLVIITDERVLSLYIYVRERSIITKNKK